MKIAFLDRDGVINVEKNYLHKINEFEFIDDVFTSCFELQKLGYSIAIVTNQAGIARGYYTEQQYLELNNWMLEQFSKQGINVIDVEYCPHHSEAGLGKYKIECECRKPKPGMILRICKKFNVNPNECILVGDKLSDVEAGKSAGVGLTVLVNTGHSISALESTQADLFVESLTQLVDHLNKRE